MKRLKPRRTPSKHRAGRTVVLNVDDQIHVVQLTEQQYAYRRYVHEPCMWREICPGTKGGRFYYCRAEMLARRPPTIHADQPGVFHDNHGIRDNVPLTYMGHQCRNGRPRG